MNSYQKAWNSVGGLSQPSKMPCYGYSLPAAECKIGSMLRKIKGSTCSRCYAFKGNYPFRHVQTAMYRRLRAIHSQNWTKNMITLIRDQRYFRWYDSGDIQNVAHFAKIVAIAKQCPNTKFWIPTRERAIINEFLEKGGVIPRNLVVRISAAMIGQRPDSLPMTVGSSVDCSSAFQCPASTQGNYCGDCRKCWDKRTKNVSYSLH